MSDLKLKPCPFCGAEPETDYRQGYRTYSGGQLDHAAAIYCTSCNVQFTLCRADVPELTDDDRMFILSELWNARVPA